MKRIVYFMSAIFLSLSLITNLWARKPDNPDQNKAETIALYQSLLDLTYPFTIMCVAAHPDDEDSEALTYYRLKYGARTVLVTSTRGEGGQNSQGPELYDELGVVRTKELAAAAQRLDAITFNLALPEFGFSKSSQETLEKWGHKEALRRMVYAIRLFQPDIIITVHDPKTGHGHHQATRILVEEAFDAAADRYTYPEQISAKLEPWQAKRLFARTFGKSGHYDTEFDVNEIAPARNVVYTSVAFESRQQHRTQGPWTKPDFTGERMVRYNLIKNLGGEFRRWYMLAQGLPDPAIYTQIEPMIFDDRAPTPLQAMALPRAELIARLANAINKVRAYLKGDGRDDDKARVLEGKLARALLLAAKLNLTIAANVEKTAPGLDFTAKATLANQGGMAAEIVDLRLALPDDWDYKEIAKPAAALEPGASANGEYAISLGMQAVPTLPVAAHLYDANFLQPQVIGIARVIWKGLDEPLLLRGDARVEVAAAVEMAIAPNDILINTVNLGHTDSYPVLVRIDSNLRAPLSGRLRVAGNQVARVAPEDQQFNIGAQGNGVITFLVTVGRPAPEGEIDLPVTIIDNAGREVTSSLLRFHLAKVQCAPDLRVGYLRSFDYTLPQALKFLGARSSELSMEEISAGNLAGRYNTIVLDNRAYLAHPELVKINNRLLDFVRDGGTLIVLYQRPTDWNRASPALSPYPIKLGDDRITDENAPITILLPDHPLMKRPNQISEEDFGNWIQERGLSFPEKWDDRYRTLLASADAGEQPLKGGWLVADYGRGQYIYTSYVIYRQLRAFNAGAYRLFANMISLPKTR